MADNSDSKYIKGHFIGLDLSTVKYMSDIELSDVIIYPTLNKYQFTEIYSWLNNKLIEDLNQSSTCAIIGYSLRDPDIKKIFIESLQKNKNLG